MTDTKSNAIASVSLTLGNAQIKCEGPIFFLRDGMVDVAKQALRVLDESGALHIPSESGGATLPELSISTIAAEVGCKSGPDLVLCALAKFLLADGSKNGTMLQIREEMRQAGAFFKKSYTANLHKTLARLVKNGRIRDQGKNIYALSPQEEAKFRSAFGVS